MAECGYEGAPRAFDFLIHYGATLKVNLGLDSNWHRGLQSPPKSSIQDVEALIDTGADESFIDTELAATLQLNPIDRRIVCGIGSMEVDVYLAQIFVPALKFIIEGRFSGVPLKQNGHRYTVLLGRTFLRYCKLNYNGHTAAVSIHLIPEAVQTLQGG